MLGFRDEVEAYYLDRAVTVFGQAVEADLEEASMNAKDTRKATQARQRVMERWLDQKPTFRDPMAGGKEPGKTQQGGTSNNSVSSDLDGAVVL